MSSTKLFLNELLFTFKRMKESPLSIAGLAIVTFYICLAIAAPILAPPQPGRDPYIMPSYGISPIPRPPSKEAIWGTTEGQYDLYYGCIWGTRTAFRTGIITTIAVVILGIIIGSIAGYFGGKVDEIIMRITDIFYAIPTIVLAMAIVVLLGVGLDNVIKALIIVGWPTYARLMRAEILRIKNEDYVEAAKAVGCSNFRILVKHVLPNAIYPVLIMGSMNIGNTVLAASALSFLGLGSPAGYADWGSLISLSRNWILGLPGNPLAFWHTYTIPGLFIFTFVLGWNLLGDAFRDMLDPLIRRR
ncbi:MAG: ABC transporter permease [archaeon YNP-LCB-003-016]|jgi:peptide/nickel transport system permease protein|uniref:ABC transporter permease n=1 Tax=Candidatus Culexarchaeum yellowstonense TaxID=2928963 RepID=UPI0026E9AF55|nr:ABC transporter permease [Candidatus Culexarchaeum yellowstonense]MCR6692382.1 ABC transporter permease [Candidatus Culexarchaeum yellowstonense]